MRVAIIGHVVDEPARLDLPADPRKARALIDTCNYTRVEPDDGGLWDHIAYFNSRYRPADDPLAGSTASTVWEMRLCAVLLLASHLRRHGITVRTVNDLSPDTADRVHADLADFRPDAVVLSTTFILSRKQFSAAVTRIRAAAPAATIIAGGHFVFTNLLALGAAERLRFYDAMGADVYCNDTQGEAALLAYCRAWPGDVSGVANMAWRSADGTFVENARHVEANDVNDTPILFDASARGAVAHIRTARSCSFKCAFCSYPTIAGPLALMELETVLPTLRSAVDHQVGAIVFIDDTFNVPANRFEALLDRMIAEGIRLPWYSFLRCQYITPQIVGKMAATGCAGVFLGIEHGSNKILKLMKKGAIIDFYWDGIRWLRDAGIKTVGSFIVGFPGETAGTVDELHRFITGSGLDYYFIQPFYYLHHTPIHKRAADFGLRGAGLRWTHNSMNWQEAHAHIHRLTMAIDDPVAVNPDYTLWELIYLRSHGQSWETIRAYRREVMALTRRQMLRHQMVAPRVNARPWEADTAAE